MSRHRASKVLVAGLIGAALVAGGALAGADWGVRTQARLDDNSESLFGFQKPLATSSTTSADLAAEIGRAHV